MRFSIIIPIYNAASTLCRCLKSIQGQDFSDYQVLLVDDGSTDGSGTLAGAFAAGDSRFCLISAPHAGTGAARNRGFAQAEGEYVLYLDADDLWIREDLLSELDRQITSQSADVYMYQMVKVTEEGGVLSRYTKPPFRAEGTVQPLRDVYADLVRDGQTLASACNKCVRASLLRQREIRFREDVLGEDIDWVLGLFSQAQTICLLNLPAYAYTQHKNSSRSTERDAPNDLVEIILDWSRRALEDGTSHTQAVAGLIAFEYGICMGNHHRLSPERKGQMKRNAHLLRYGLDKKTRLILRFYRVFGYRLTCLAIRVYLGIRRIW